jgi:pimeloyl-ACP methyl ester carboxylesterase
MGAQTAAVLAVRRPDVVAGIVLEDPPWSSSMPPGEHTLNPFEGWIRDLQRLDHAGRVALARAEHPGWADDELDPWAESKAQVDVRLFALPQDWRFGAWPELLPKVRCPVLLITGEQARGAVIGTEDAALAGRLLGARGTVVQLAAGHSIRREQRAAYVELVAGFVSSVIARPGDR